MKQALLSCGARRQVQKVKFKVTWGQRQHHNQATTLGSGKRKRNQRARQVSTKSQGWFIKQCKRVVLVVRLRWFFSPPLFQVFHKVIWTFCFYLCARRKLQSFEITKLWAAREKIGYTHPEFPPKGNTGVGGEGGKSLTTPTWTICCTTGPPQGFRGRGWSVCACVHVVGVSCDEEQQQDSRQLWSCLQRWAMCHRWSRLPPCMSPHHPQVTPKCSVRHIYRKLCAMAVFPTVSFLDHKAWRKACWGMGQHLEVRRGSLGQL